LTITRADKSCRLNTLRQRSNGHVARDIEAIGTTIADGLPFGSIAQPNGSTERQ
jgi:hypothetical protein